MPGFSEPNAGAPRERHHHARPRRRPIGVDGQKLWTSQAQFAQWIFALCRTDTDGPKHKGLSFVLVPIDQPGVEVRPLVEMTGSDHFCEVFFDGATTNADLIVGGPGDGWKVAMGRSGSSGGRHSSPSRSASSSSSRVAGTGRSNGPSPTRRSPAAGRRTRRLEIMRYSGFRTITA